MKLFFWQNINSMHQSAFFRAIVQLDGIAVTLIVTEKIANSRLAMGWDLPEIKGLQIIDISNQNSEIWKNLVDLNSDHKSLHIFSGINAFPKVHMVFLYAIKKKCKVGVFTEPLDFRGIKGVLRNIRGYYHGLLFQKRIALVLVTGKSGCDQFKNWGYSKNKVFEWSYTVEKSKSVNKESSEFKKSVFHIMFAGSLFASKGYDILIKALKINLAEGLIFKADFYCLNENELQKGKSIEEENSLGKEINLLPFIPNNELRILMNSYDLFVLPSRYDGWGAVINESLAAGTPVLVSSKCGSSTLITHSFVGSKISDLQGNNLAKILKFHINKGIINNEERSRLQNWHDSNVSGESMAKYLVDIIYFSENQEKQIKPRVPWEL